MSTIDTHPALDALVVYESMFGCTEKVAVAVARGLMDAGATVILRDVRRARTEDLPAFDLLVVGAPTHAFSLSRPTTRKDAVQQGASEDAEPVGLREWISALGRHEPAEERAVAAFDTRMSLARHVPKSAATRAAHLLAHQGFRLVARPVGFVVDDLRGPVTPGEEERARAWGQRLYRLVALAKVATG